MALETALARAFEAFGAQLHTALPGRVEKYDAATQTADVLPMIQLQGLALPVLPNVPVAFPRGGGGFLSFPLESGDFVFLLFAESSIDQWRAKGALTNPGDPRRHSLTAAVALPCLYPSAGALADAHASQVALAMDGGKGVFVDTDAVNLGAPAPSDGVGLDSLIEARLTELKNAVSVAFGALTPLPGAPVDAATLLTNTLLGLNPLWPAPTGSSVVKSE
jgi:hypothetical protein